MEEVQVPAIDGRNWRAPRHMLAFGGDSHVEWFEGNYQDYEADKKRRLGIAAEQPHRIKYKRFARA